MLTKSNFYVQLPGVSLCRSSVTFIVLLSISGLATVAARLQGSDFFHDLFKFSKVSVLKKMKPFLALGYFLTLNSSTDTNSGVHQNACRLRCLITPLYLTLSLPCHFCSNYSIKQKLIFHNFQGPTPKFHNLSGLKNEILKFHDFPGCP